MDSMNIDETGLANAASNLTVNPVNANNQTTNQSTVQPQYVPALYPSNNRAVNQPHSQSVSNAINQFTHPNQPMLQAVNQPSNHAANFNPQMPAFKQSMIQSSNQPSSTSLMPHNQGSNQSNTQPSNQTMKKKSISYAAERVIGNGSFGVVYQATVVSTGANNQPINPSNSQTNNQMTPSSSNNQSINQSTPSSLSSSSSNQSINQSNNQSQNQNQANGDSIHLYPGATVAIKKVLQDRRFKNRELDLLSTLIHPNIVQLLHCFYSRSNQSSSQSNNQTGNQTNSQSKSSSEEDLYLNLVMEYIPETLSRTLRNHTRAQKLVPSFLAKMYIYQICRGLAYIHEGITINQPNNQSMFVYNQSNNQWSINQSINQSNNICHRDIKPQNLLLDPSLCIIKICDFGSAKKLEGGGGSNVSYICSRFYRAPELIFESRSYTPSIDVWSMGCVFAEILTGRPLFPGEGGIGQIMEIMKVLGTPSKKDIFAMNPTPPANFSKFPNIPSTPWEKVFKGVNVSLEAINLLSRWLVYTPGNRLSAFDSLSHPYFDELRGNNQSSGIRLPNGREAPPLFNWQESELRLMIVRAVNQSINQVNQSNIQSNNQSITQQLNQLINLSNQFADELYEEMTPLWARPMTLELFRTLKQAVINSNTQSILQTTFQSGKYSNMN